MPGSFKSTTMQSKCVDSSTASASSAVATGGDVDVAVADEVHDGFPVGLVVLDDEERSGAGGR